MSEAPSSGTITAVVPCNDLDASERFYNRLGFTRLDRPAAGEDDSYRILSNGQGAHLHLTEAVKGWVVPGKNPFGLYLSSADVDKLAAKFIDEIIGADGPSDKAWGMYEFALSDPDGVLVRVGLPSALPRSPA
ncbi:glyoxalase [Roseiarcaceae bacterium H3SJ34-1]|uniref:VOC family protein n=1 Tax=Terripilifer ovatus TaxID=3032367 RepID=UPI003AB97BCD|nr:glyoxalase [Roseiarcaceae bacterium H3SJ34-1]